MQEIDVHAHSSAAPERLFALLADAASWPEWSPLEELESVEGEGSGQLRRYRTGRVHGVERVTTFEPPERFGYELLEGLPVRDYRAQVTLAAAPAGGTDVRWRSAFEPKLPGTGWAIRRRLQQFIGDCAEG
ncbi:MAG: SRPBCC family protein, partial [Solirubrobacteraceae bacterium]